MRIALDVDGVLANMIEPLLRLYEDETGVRITVEEVDDWDFWKKRGISKQKFIELMIRTWSRWWEIEPLEDDVSEDVDKLNRLGHVDIVTQRPAKTIGYVKEWLARNKIRYRKFTWVPPRTTKAKLSYDIYIDDSPKLAEELNKLGRPMLLYNQPWNRSFGETSIIRRVYSLDDCIRILENGNLLW